MSPTQARKLLKREDRIASILAAAARAFAVGGFAATSMEDIAAEAGVTKLIVYRHFATKQELYERAKELDIPRRSAMTKDELARAIARREG